MKKKSFKTWVTRVLLLLICLCFSAWYAHRRIEQSTQNQSFTNTDNVPFNKVALLLGTSPKAKSGRINLFFKYRMEAILELYQAHKIQYILVSGDNGNKNYNETDAMKEYLMNLGIPDTAIYTDYAGFRTLDSVVRSKDVFGQNSITIVSQQFHNERAVYLAQAYGINAVGFNATTPNMNYSVMTFVREYFARLKVFWDLNMGVKPKFLGEKIQIG
jgi:SanA protein